MLQVKGVNHKRCLNLWLSLMPLQWHGVYMARGSKIFADVDIGFGTRMNGPVIIKGQGKAVIGKYCAIGDGLRLITSNHDLQRLSIQNLLQYTITGCHVSAETQGVNIGHDVWIGDNVIVLPGVNIGDGAVIGAGSIVTRDVRSYHVVAGNPARHIKSRFPEHIVELLETLQWWDWSIGEMKARRFMFEFDFSVLSEQDLEKIKSNVVQKHE